MKKELEVEMAVFFEEKKLDKELKKFEDFIKKRDKKRSKK